MDYDDYLKIKNKSGNNRKTPVPRVRGIEITNDDELKEAKEEIERYEDENFNVTYEDYQKLDECFESAVNQLQYVGDDTFGHNESDLARIVRVMNFLDWVYAFQKSDRMTESECLECLDSLYRDAVRYISERRTKRVTMATGGWYVDVNLEYHSVTVHFCLFDYSEYYDELAELKKLEERQEYED